MSSNTATGSRGTQSSNPRLPRKLRQKQAKKVPLKGKPRAAKEKSSSAQWITYRELDTECAYFPLEQSPFAAGRTENRTYTVRLAYDQALTSDGSGLLQTVLTNLASSAQNWSNYAAVFDEHRVLAMSVQFEPLHAVGGSTQTYWAPVAHVTDRSDATALTGYSLAERYDSHVKTPGGRKFTHKWNMASIDEANFISTAAPAANAWIKFYSSGNSLSLTLGRLDVRIIVQFRGLGIN